MGVVAQTPYQAQYAITDLQTAATPNGSEVLEVIQNGISVQLTLNQVIAALGTSIFLSSPTIRLPAFASTIPILTSDIEVGISTASGPVTASLPSAALWAAAAPGGASGLDLVLLDRTGNALTNNITFALNGSDTFLQGTLPPLAVNFGSLRLRPFGTPGTNTPIVGWYVKGFG
jgi:hypothetical protein